MAQIVTPESQFTIVDNSAITTSTTTVTYNGPVFLIASAAPKGPEEMTVVPASTKGIKFFTKYGIKPSFAKYGQALLTAGILAQDEAKLIFKRIVAADATLANLVIYAQITSSSTQKTNSDGYLVYTDSAGNETIIADGNTAVMEKKYKVKYTGKSFSDVTSIKGLSTLVKSTLDETNMIYPLFVITDNGRGISNKKIRICSNSTASKKLSYMKYYLEVIENSTILETLNFTSNPDISEYEKNMSIQTVISQYSDQIKCELFESYWELMSEKLSTLQSNYTYDELMNLDLFNCKDRTGVSLTDISLDNSTGYANLSYTYGLSLDNGSNGSFGTYPINSDDYANELVNFFNGNLTTDIYDIDNFKIDIIPDANYPISVKKAITSLCDVRIDPYFLRDMCILDTTYSDIISNGEDFLENSNNSMYSGTYPLFYDIIDPFSNKQITVTSILELCELLIPHFVNGRSRPFAGSMYGIKFSRWIEGTENFRPINLPDVKQKDNFIEYRLNYATKYDEGNFIQDTQITSQIDYTQATFMNNILLIQKVIKDIRTVAPSIRYSFLDKADLADYQDTVTTKVLNKVSSLFDLIELVYIEDTTAKQNKIYQAALNVVFKDFVQQEQFTIYLNNSNS